MSSAGDEAQIPEKIKVPNGMLNERRRQVTGRGQNGGGGKPEGGGGGWKGGAKRVILEILVGVIVLAIGGAGGKLFADRRYEQRYAAAITKYSEEIGKLIEKASSAQDDELLMAARTIVDTRDDLRSSIEALDKLLDSEIDLLKTQLGSNENSDEHMKNVQETIQVLHGKWPSKKTQIDVEVRKLFIELGLQSAD